MMSGQENVESRLNIAIDSDNTTSTHTWFDSSKKSDEEIVASSNYKFYLPIEELINNSDKTRLARKNRKRKKAGVDIKIPRRQNAWILYLRDKSPQFKGLQAKAISKMWSQEPNETVEVFEALSRMATKQHKDMFGDDYVYTPQKNHRPSKSMKKLNKKRKQNRNKKENKGQQFLPTPVTSNIQSPVTPSNFVFEEHSSDEPTAYTEQQLLLEVAPNVEHDVFPASAGKCQPLQESNITEFATNGEQYSPVPNFESFKQNEYKKSAANILPTPATSNHQSPVTSNLVFEDHSFPTPLTPPEEFDEQSYTERQLFLEVTPNVEHDVFSASGEQYSPVPNFNFLESLKHNESTIESMHYSEKHSANIIELMYFPESSENKEYTIELVDKFSTQSFFAYSPADSIAAEQQIFPAPNPAYMNGFSQTDWLLYSEIEGLDNLKDIGESNNP